MQTCFSTGLAKKLLAAARRLSADFGDPTARRRLFILGRKGLVAPPAPEATHGEDRSERHRTARDIIDWTDLGLPVEQKLNRLSLNTRNRIEMGLEEFNGEPFILPRRQHQNFSVRSVDRPLHTITTTSWDIQLITPRKGTVYHRCLKVPELLRAMSFPGDYKLVAANEDQVRQIGNAAPIMSGQRHIEALLTL